jgi:hypothetical protein
MLDRKGKRLDLQEVGITQRAIDIDAQRMCCQFGVQSGTQAPKDMDLIGLNMLSWLDSWLLTASMTCRTALIMRLTAGGN